MMRSHRTLLVCLALKITVAGSVAMPNPDRKLWRLLPCIRPLAQGMCALIRRSGSPLRTFPRRAVARSRSSIPRMTPWWKLSTLPRRRARGRSADCPTLCIIPSSSAAAQAVLYLSSNALGLQQDLRNQGRRGGVQGPHGSSLGRRNGRCPLAIHDPDRAACGGKPETYGGCRRQRRLRHGPGCARLRP